MSRTAAPSRAAAVVALLLGVSLLAACSPAGPAEVSASMRSNTRPVSELDGGSSVAPDDPGGDLGDLDDLEDLQDELQEGFEDLLPPDVSVPELDQLGECADLAAAYAELIALAFTGDPEDRIDGVIDQLGAALPAELDDDLETVRGALNRAADGGLLDATGELSDPAFRSATTEITSWLAERCGADQGEGA